ncbi:hypothetical protein KUCAC02_012133, partial [Chaenocephalus aceratus]
PQQRHLYPLFRGHYGAIRLHDAALLLLQKSLQPGGTGGIRPPARQRGASLAAVCGRSVEEEKTCAESCRLLEELTQQQHCCFNPGGARLLPGNLLADSDRTRLSGTNAGCDGL